MCKQAESVEGVYGEQGPKNKNQVDKVHGICSMSQMTPSVVSGTEVWC